MKFIILFSLLMVSFNTFATSYWHDYCRPAKVVTEDLLLNVNGETFDFECEFEKYSGRNCEIEKRLSLWGARATFHVSVKANSGEIFSYKLKYKSDEGCKLISMKRNL